MPSRKKQPAELSVREMFRLAHAFHGGSRFKEGQKVFVVMSRQAPMYRIQGTFASAAEAKAAMKSRPKGWSREELGKRQIIPIAAPPQQFEWGGKNALPNFGDIEWLELRVKVKKGKLWTYELPTNTDMITLSPAAYHVFLYRYYLDHFGRRYADARLKAASDAASGGGSAKRMKTLSARSSQITTQSTSREPLTVTAHTEWTEDVRSPGQET